jgi:hypothetical protein
MSAFSRGPAGRTVATSWRADHAISAEDILRAAGTTDEPDATNLSGSPLVDEVVRPLLAEAERALLGALARINVEDMTRRVDALK